MGIFGAILYFIFCIIVGAAASNRGRSGVGYFFLSLFLSPLIGFIIILVLGENKNIRKDRIHEDAEIRESVASKYRDESFNNSSAFRNVSNNKIAYMDTKKCPFCAEEIKKEAIVCKFCNRDLPMEDKKVLIESVKTENDILKDNKNDEIEKLEKLFDQSMDENEKGIIAKKLYDLGKMYYWRFIPRDKK